jgi:choline dehydrogenase
VNGCVALRGTPSDYDEWEALGNSNWNWANVLPVFIRIEDDPDARGAITDTAARSQCVDMRPPSSVRCRGHLPKHVEASAFQLRMTTTIPKPRVLGSGHSTYGTIVRVSTAIAYLLPARGRPNLTIRSECLVDRVRFDGKHAVGVEVEGRDDPERILGKQSTKTRQLPRFYCDIPRPAPAWKTTCRLIFSKFWRHNQNYESGHSS